MRWDVEGLKPSVGAPPAARAVDRDARTCSKSVETTAGTVEAAEVESE